MKEFLGKILGKFRGSRRGEDRHKSSPIQGDTERMKSLFQKEKSKPARLSEWKGSGNKKGRWRYQETYIPVEASKDIPNPNGEGFLWRKGEVIYFKHSSIKHLREKFSGNRASKYIKRAS